MQAWKKAVMPLQGKKKTRKNEKMAESCPGLIHIFETALKIRSWRLTDHLGDRRWSRISLDASFSRVPFYIVLLLYPVSSATLRLPRVHVSLNAHKKKLIKLTERKFYSTRKIVNYCISVTSVIISIEFDSSRPVCFQTSSQCPQKLHYLSSDSRKWNCSRVSRRSAASE